MADALPLDRWANFYLIASAAAATLIGLLFVVIILAAERRPDEAGKIRLYLGSVLRSARPRCRGAWQECCRARAHAHGLGNDGPHRARTPQLLVDRRNARVRASALSEG
jgi:hypothetical protein